MSYLFVGRCPSLVLPAVINTMTKATMTEGGTSLFYLMLPCQREVSAGTKAGAWRGGTGAKAGGTLPCLASLARSMYTTQDHLSLSFPSKPILQTHQLSQMYLWLSDGPTTGSVA